MKRYRCPSPSAPLAFAFTAIALFLTSCVALAEPIKYTGFLITDGQLGNWKFYNARVMLTFSSDTKYVETLSEACVGTTAAFNSTGAATVTIVDHQKVVTARFDPNQIFVAFDQSFGGVGFGSFAPGPAFDPATCSNAGSLQPAYPLGLHHGTMDNAGNPFATDYSPNQLAFPNNLQGTVGFSGKGYTCVGVPQQECDPPTAPLTTDHGDLYLQEPYQAYSDSGYLESVNGAFFFQETGGSGLPLPASALAPSTVHSNGSITYHLLLVSDVSLDGELFQNATIHLSFQSRISNVTKLFDAGPNSAMNSQGVARVAIRQGRRTVSANFDPGQLYAYFDPSTGSVGFGSNSGGRAYQATLATTFAHSDTELMAAVADIITTGATY